MRLKIRDIGRNFIAAAMLVLCAGPGLARANGITGEPPLTDLEDFIIYEEPRVIDALRKRPFTQRDPLVEQFFRQLPEISDRVYKENLSAMRSYLQRSEQDKERKLRQLAQKAGLDSPPKGLIDGYNERIKYLNTILTWLGKVEPVQLVQLAVWKEHELRYRLQRFPVENIRLNPLTNELESRLLFNWQMIYQNRPRAMDVKLEFAIGLHQQEQTGFYNPRGFLHWYKLSAKNLKPVELTYPVIITEALRNNPEQWMPAYLAAYETTVDSFYHIIREFFFSDLADLHALYILTRGKIFSDEWRQFQTTPLQRGLAACLAFQTVGTQIGESKINEILENDWTTWRLRKIGDEFNSLAWENEKAPAIQYGAYKTKPDLSNIYWSTKFVYYLAEKYGDSFVSRFCEAMKKNQPGQGTYLSEKELFNRVTGDDLEALLVTFAAGHSPQ